MMQMSSRPFSLAGRKALVTGAATGLGRAIAVGLAEAGADIVGVYHQSPPDETAQSVRALGQAFFGIQADLGDPACVRGIVEHAGDIDILRSEEHTSELQSIMSISYAVL